jgi:cell division protein FtsW
MRRALEAIQSGGLLGRGPGEGVVKDSLPDAHADFVYAVAAEEFGVFASVGLLALYVVIVWRGMARAARVIDPFAQIAAGGLFALLGLQALVHVAVNVSLAPAKGMTLPLVSYGGSSMIGSGITLGLALAFVRARSGALLYEKDGE